MSLINFPILYIPDPAKGRPLFAGQIYVGEPDLDPTVAINQKQLNVIEENGTIVPVAQPFILSAGGVPQYNGKAVRLDVTGNYSIKILSKLGAQVYYIENAFEGEPLTEIGLADLLSQAYEFATVADYKAYATDFPVGKVINLLDRGARFTVISGTGTANSFDIIASDNVLQSIELIMLETMNIDAFGSGAGGDITLATQAALDYSAANKVKLTNTGATTYQHSMLVIKNGSPEIDFSKGTMLPDGTTNPDNITTEAAFVLEGLLTGGTSVVSDCIVSINIDMQNGDSTAILGDGSLSCTFTKNKIYGFVNNATYNHRGIRLQEAPSRNLVIDNEIVGYSIPTKRGLLLELINTFATNVNFAGYFTGTSVRQPNPALRNTITNNKFTNGSYALNSQGSEHTIFSNNICHNQNHRGIWMGNGSWFNVVDGNQFKNFLSSAVLCGYSCNHNVITNNKCTNDEGYGANGEAVMNINTGSSYNLIANNHCDAPMNYSVYIGPDSSNNMVDGNYSKNAYVAAFCAENDWIDTNPTNSFYNRPNYADPDQSGDPTATSWTFNDLTGTTFQNNIVHSGFAGRSIAAFAINQIQNDLAGATPTSHIGTILKGNRVLTNTNIGYGLYVYEQITGNMQDIELSGGNNWDSSLLPSTLDFAGANTTSSALDFRDVGLTYAQDNGTQINQLVNLAPIVFDDADTTPAVSEWDNFSFANTGATSVTDFDNSYDNQEISIRLDANTTLIHNASVLRLKGNVDLVGNSSIYVTLKKLGTIWLEISRNT